MKARQTMMRMKILRTNQDEDDDFDFRQNDYDTAAAAMQVADRSVETVSDSPRNCENVHINTVP